MNLDRLQYAASRATERQIHDHLSRCDGRYDPPLSQRVDIGEYAKKLHERARTLEAWHDDALVGLVAIYIDEPASRAFVTSVSVDEGFAGHGIGSRLVGDAVALARSHGVSTISLEVSPRSVGAIQVYEKHGFRRAGGDKDMDTLQMQLSLNEQAG